MRCDVTYSCSASNPSPSWQSRYVVTSHTPVQLPIRVRAGNHGTLRCLTPCAVLFPANHQPPCRSTSCRPLGALLAIRFSSRFWRAHCEGGGLIVTRSAPSDQEGAEQPRTPSCEETPDQSGLGRSDTGVTCGQKALNDQVGAKWPGYYRRR